MKPSMKEKMDAVQSRFRNMTPEQKEKFEQIANKYHQMLHVMSGIEGGIKVSWKIAFKNMGIPLPVRKRDRGKAANAMISQMMRDELIAAGVIFPGRTDDLPPEFAQKYLNQK